MTEQDKIFMRAAIRLAATGMDDNRGGPFGTVIVKDGEVIAEAHNNVTSNNDPTAHAEVEAIRTACQKLGTFQLDECTLYTSCEPCPMCLGAIYWAGLKKVYYGCRKEDAADIGFDDQFIYEELAIPLGQRSVTFTPLLRNEAVEVFKEWTEKENRIDY